MNPWRRPGAGLAAAAVLVMGTAGPGGAIDPELPDLVQFGGVSTVYVFGERACWPVVRGESDPPLILPLHDGDILLLGADEDSEFLVPYRRQEDGLSPWLQFDGPVLRVNSHPRVLALTADGWAWLATAPDTELAGLRLVTIEEPAADAVVLLRRLAGANPRVGLGIGDLQNDLQWPEALEFTPALGQALAGFQPRLVMISAEALASGDPDDVQRQSFASWSAAETLITCAATPDGLSILGDLPRLRRLVLFGWDPAQTGPMPAGLAGLRHLSIFGGELIDLRGLASLTGLTRLTISGDVELQDISGLLALPALLSVDLCWCDGIIDLWPLFTLADLEHAGLPATATQGHIADLVERLPGLVSLDVSACQEIQDLSPLAGLAGLDRLTVGPQTQLAALADCARLRYLEVRLDHDDAREADQRRDAAAVAEALPECRVVTNAGICLGSGYLLLLAPAVILARWLGRRRAARAGAADDASPPAGG